MRRVFVLLAAGGLAMGLFTPAVSAAASTSPRAVVDMSSHGPNACASTLPAKGHFAGIVRAQAVTAACQARTSDAARGHPPLIWHGGPVMGTPSTRPVVVTPIFWQPAGHRMDGKYESIITAYLAGVAHDSGLHTNVFSTLNEYYGSNGTISYQVQLGTPIVDNNRLPADGCTVASSDTANIYADHSGYNACLDDAQIQTETNNVISARNLPVDLGHMYVLFLAKHVESCFFAGSTTTSDNFCTINHQPSAAYCAYHNENTSGSPIYSNMPYPIYASAVGFTCGSDARFPVVQTPNHNADGDTEVSPTSHEIMESITDPDTVSGWYDARGYENGDECAYVFGPTLGKTGQAYNQVINGHHYLTQEEFSNLDFANTGLGCLQSE